ncbi:MAG: efflux RND transporter permease subunit, partial [Gammaproteobacteria bacterium]
LGMLTYITMPRAKDPEINFNWVNILTVFPGAAAVDMERRVTDPLEDVLRSTIKDIKFALSSSRDGISNILIRFNRLDADVFDNRLIDVRREVQNTYTSQLPDAAEDPVIYDINTSNAFPTAMIIVTGPGNDENLWRQVRNIRKDMERISGVERVDAVGLPDPELHVTFIPERLEGLGITPVDIADTIRVYFSDVSAGDLETPDGQWIVRLQGTSGDPSVLRDFPVMTANGVVPLGAVAELSRQREEYAQVVRYLGRPAVVLTAIKQADANVIELIDRLSLYIEERNRLSDATGVQLVLADDQTVSTREALTLMQRNASIGLALVLFVTWMFLGTRIALLTSIGIPFTLSGTFLVLNSIGFTINNTVLLGVVISLGMIVDDAVVVVESIYQRLQQGLVGMTAIIESLREVFAPVTTSVLTTVAAFLPLVLLPGILGDFMRVVPLVVTFALLISLVEAYWMLPAHVLAFKVNFANPGKIQKKRVAGTHWIRLHYTRLLLKALRYPSRTLCIILFVIGLAAITLLSGKIKFNFFATEPIRLFYVNVEMPASTSLQDTSKMLVRIEKQGLTALREGELRASLTYAGQQFTETEPLFADTIGQIMFSLNPQKRNGRHVFEIAEQVRQRVQDIPGPINITLLEIRDGPPTRRAVSVKVKGDDYAVINAATSDLRQFLESNPLYRNVAIDYRPGNPELVLRMDGEAIQRAGINPAIIGRVMQSYVDGQVVTDFQDEGEEVKVRVLSRKDGGADIDSLMRQTLSLPDGQSVTLGELLIAEPGLGQRNIQHYNFRRTITLESDIDKDQTDTIKANDLIKEKWLELQADYPSITLDFTGELDDLQESLDSIWLFFLLGVGIIYIILGTQFRSYWQPFMIIATVPLAFTGVTLGLLVTGNPLSLYTMYGVVALAGISVNAAIVLISAANQRMQRGMSLLHATVYAGRRRVIPILITSLTTIAGLFSLAAGIAGQSLIWGPVATAIVWGLAFSTMLTLIVVPLLYHSFMGLREE